MNQRNILFVVVAVLGVVLDQATKWWIVHNLPVNTGHIDLIPGFLSIVHAQNPGAAFGIFRDFEYRYLVFLGFAVIAVGVLLDLLRKLPKDDRFMSVTLGMILSGALGNAIDRVRHQVVTDFIRVYTDSPSLKGWLIDTFGTNEWPSFNVADVALVVGVGLFVIHQLFFEQPPAEAPAGDAPTRDPLADAPVPSADDEDTDLDPSRPRPALSEPGEAPTDPGGPRPREV